jgi:hypothetical protein
MPIDDAQLVGQLGTPGVVPLTTLVGTTTPTAIIDLQVVEPPVAPAQPSGAQHPFVFSPLRPARFEARLPGRVSGSQRRAFLVAGRTGGHVTRHTFTVSGSTAGQRALTFSVPGHREPADHYGRLLTEDEELILLGL